MPRQARKKSKSGIYHVMLRGINHQILFEDDEDREKFLDVIKTCKEKSGYKVYGYCLMDNHVHLLIREEDEQLGSVINANGTTILKSGEDTNIIGSQVKGDKVIANAGGNLNIASKQDTDNYTSNTSSSGIGFGMDKIGETTGSINKGKIDSTYSSVTEQAGIYAGNQGFDINVAKNTDLKGAVISSDAMRDNGFASGVVSAGVNEEERTRQVPSESLLSYYNILEG